MTKNCLTCSFLCEKQPNGRLKTVLKSYRHPLMIKEIRDIWSCYYEQWTNGQPKSSPFARLRAKEERQATDEDIAIYVSASEGESYLRTTPFIILTQHKCKHYHRFDPSGTISADRLAEERKFKSENRRFALTIFLSTLTTIAVILTSLFHLIEIMKDTP